jgi:hypothetical protein
MVSAVAICKSGQRPELNRESYGLSALGHQFKDGSEDEFPHRFGFIIAFKSGPGY